MRSLLPVLLAVFVCLPTFSSAVELKPEQVRFQYLGLFEPYVTGTCTHMLNDPDQNPFDWDVLCNVEGKVHRYTVHLAVDFYPKTAQGVSAYEILYWVSDSTLAKTNHSSSTTWVHNTEANNRMAFLELSQGIEDDAAYLKLELNLK